MDILVKAAQFLLSLSLLIVLHEMGHFLFAKLFKCRVEKFYLFFDAGFSLFKYKRGETEYGLGWLPLGGYVKISGMIDESMDKDQMKQPVQPYEFRAKKPYQRLLIMLGGVLMNFLTAIVIYIGILYAWGDQYLPVENVKYGIEVNEVGYDIGFRNGDKIVSVDNEIIENFSAVMSAIVLNKASNVQVLRNGSMVDVAISEEDIAKMIRTPGIFGIRYPFRLTVAGFGTQSPALEAGLEIGDKIQMVDGRSFEFHDEFTSYLMENAGKQVLLTVNRDNNQLEIPLTLSDKGMLGVTRDNNYADVFEFKTINYGLIESIPAGIARGWETSTDYLKQFKLIFSRTTKGYESLGGFITIGNIFPGVWNWRVFWNMTAFLSIILAIMNILPIPALDGGHVMFVLYEMISGRKPSEKFLEYAQYIGLSIILVLVLYANANDIIRLFR